MRVKRHKRGALVRVLPIWTKKPPGKVVSTVSKHSDLSPFLCGPVDLYDGYTAYNVENAWQFSKVYSRHVTDKGVLLETAYYQWAVDGWEDHTAHRYPMGKGAIPLFSYWERERLGYIDARKIIYGPLYAEAVQKTEAWQQLLRDYYEYDELTLLDYDAYDHKREGMTLTNVLNEPNRKMGHAFVLAMLLTRDKALNQMGIR